METSALLLHASHAWSSVSSSPARLCGARPASSKRATRVFPGIVMAGRSSEYSALSRHAQSSCFWTQQAAFSSTEYARVHRAGKPAGRCRVDTSRACAQGAW